MDESHFFFDFFNLLIAAGALILALLSWRRSGRALAVKERAQRTGLSVGAIFGYADVVMLRSKGSRERPRKSLYFHIGFTVSNDTARPNSIISFKWELGLLATGLSDAEEIIYDFNEQTGESFYSNRDMPHERCSELPNWRIGAALPIGPGEHRRVEDFLASYAADEPYFNAKSISVTLVIKDAYGRQIRKPAEIPVPRSMDMSEFSKLLTG